MRAGTQAGGRGAASVLGIQGVAAPVLQQESSVGKPPRSKALKVGQTRGVDMLATSGAQVGRDMSMQCRKEAAQRA